MTKATEWTKEQEELIRQKYLELGPKKLGQLMGVASYNLANKAKKMGINLPKPYQWKEEEIKILIEKFPTEGPKKLSEIMEIPWGSLYKKARTLGLITTKRKRPPKKSEFRWTEDMIGKIKDRYESEGPKKLAEEFGLSRYTISHKARKLGLHTKAGRREMMERNNSCDIHYFDTWSPNMAYILGFLFADGCVRGNTGLDIHLSAKDEHLLEFIKKELKATYSIRRRTDKEGRVHSTIGFHSGIMVRKLIELGLQPKKSKNDFPFPDVPVDMMPHFIRGYLDGDGSINIYGKKSGHRWLYVGFIGSPKFISGIVDNLVLLAGMKRPPINTKQGKTTKWSTVAWRRIRDIWLFGKFIYPEGYGFCLQRKKENLDNWLDSKKDFPRRTERGFAHWTPEEEQIIKDSLNHTGLSKLAESLGRTERALMDRIKRLGLTHSLTKE